MCVVSRNLNSNSNPVDGEAIVLTIVKCRRGISRDRGPPPLPLFGKLQLLCIEWKEFLERVAKPRAASRVFISRK